MALRATRAHTSACMACIFIFTRNIRVIVHISILYLEFKLILIFVTIYIPDPFFQFFPCGTKFHTKFKCAGHVAERGALDQTEERITIAHVP